MNLETVLYAPAEVVGSAAGGRAKVVLERAALSWELG
jgi:hypothetical protein